MARGQLCGLVMGLTFTLVATIFFAKYFTMTTTLHMVEETLSDPAIPFLQSLSYSTTGIECGGKWARLYDLLSASTAGDSETVTVCGTEINLKDEVDKQLKRLTQISNICFDYNLADSENKDLLILKLSSKDPDCKTALKKIKSATKASYLFPLPPDKGFVARQVLTEVKPE